MKLTFPLVVVVLYAQTNFQENLLKILPSIQQQQQQQQNFIYKQIKLQKYCPQLARLFEVGQCVQNIRDKD